MNRRKLLQLAAAGAGHILLGRNTVPLANARRRIACAVRSDQLSRYASRLWSLPAIEIEDWLDPTFPERAAAAVPLVQKALVGYSGRILLSGPFIDLNPGSSERLIQRATRKRFDECHQFAGAVGAREIIFLSSYLPIINLSFYDQGWLTQSVAFWRSYLDVLDPRVTVSLCNTFEYHPNFMLKIVEEVARPNFRLAFDLGHFLVYGRVPLPDWLRTTATRTSSVYVHSNDGHVDTHDEPGRGVLTCADVNQAVAAFGPEVNLILKMNDKESLERSVSWLEACWARA
jgi:sugar phosphate isomerase/epimerase